MVTAKQRPRAADKLTRTDVRIGVCVNCGRYRGIDTETGRCAPGDAIKQGNAAALAPVRYCERNGADA